MRRQQTLAASVEWSYDLLAEPERLLLRRLCVFAGGFTLDEAEAVGAAPPIDAYAVLELLTGLVDKSLIVTEVQGATVRYRMLETIRQYGRERLAASGEEPTTRDRHLAAFLELAERTERRFHGSDEPAALERLEIEHGNLRVALGWSRTSGRREDALRLAAALAFFWYRRGHLREGVHNLEAALDGATDAPPALRGKALTGLADLAVGILDLEVAAVAATECLELARIAGDASTLGPALTTMGSVTLYNDPAGAAVYFDESLQLARAAPDEATACVALSGMAATRFFVGDFAVAVDFARESVAIARRNGYPQHIERGELILGCALLLNGNIAEALPLLEATAAEIQGAGDLLWTTTALILLGEAYSLSGRYTEAQDMLDEGFRVGSEIGTPMTVASRFYRARLALVLGEPGVARRELEQAVAVDREIGIALWLGWHLRELALVLQLLGEPEAARIHLDEAAALAAELGTDRELALILYAEGFAAHQLGDTERAAECWYDVLLLNQADATTVVDALEALAAEAAARDSFDEAARVFGACEAVRELVGYVRPSVNSTTVDAQVVRLRDVMPGDDLDARWTEGRALTLDEAVAYATPARGERKRPSSGWASLTPTELEVVALVAEGLTNKTIAERLFVAPSTVKTHLSNVFTKLDVSTRSELTAEAVRRTG